MLARSHFRHGLLGAVSISSLVSDLTVPKKQRGELEGVKKCWGQPAAANTFADRQALWE